VRRSRRFVFEYLATDNVVSLSSLESSLRQLEQVDPVHHSLLQSFRTHGAAGTAAALGLNELRTCDLYHGEYSRLDVRCPDCAANAPSPSECECRYVTDDESLAASSPDHVYAKDEGLCVGVARHVLFGCRRRHLDALRRGFQGLDQRSTSQAAADAPISHYDFSHHLACLDAHDMAVLLRGRAVSDASELEGLLLFRSPAEISEEVEQRCAPVDPPVFAAMEGWLRKVVLEFSQEEIEALLVFCTGKKTVSGLQSGAIGDPDRDRVTVCIYHDADGEMKDFKEPMTAGICTRTLYVPWHSQITSERGVKALVEQTLAAWHASNRWASGGDAFGYL
jgi:hypothetical protein